MSFIHSTIVGHFDPATLSTSNTTPSRPLDKEAVEVLLNEYSGEVRERVEWCDGYVECCWAGAFSFGIGELVHEFAYNLAERENCVAAESPFWLISYPESARKIQATAWEEWRKKNPFLEPKPPTPPVFDPTEPAPCPYCGKLMRTSTAKQCRFCKMDWHDSNNVHRRI